MTPTKLSGARLHEIITAKYTGDRITTFDRAAEEYLSMATEIVESRRLLKHAQAELENLNACLNDGVDILHRLRDALTVRAYEGN